MIFCPIDVIPVLLLSGGTSRPGEGLPPPSLRGLVRKPSWATTRSSMSEMRWERGKEVGRSTPFSMCITPFLNQWGFDVSNPLWDLRWHAQCHSVPWRWPLPAPASWVEDTCSGGTSAPVNLPAKANAAAASGWKTKAAWSFLQSLKFWGLAGAEKGRSRRPPLCSGPQCVVGACPCSKQNLTNLSLPGPLDTKEPLPTVQCPPNAATWNPCPIWMRHRHWQTLHPPRTCHLSPKWCKSSQLPVGWSMLTRCFVFLMGRTFLPQTHIFSFEGSHCVAQSVKHSGH